MPVSLCLALLLAAPHQKVTFDQIESYKHKAYRQLKDYREVFDIVSEMKSEKRPIRLAQRIAGSKLRLVGVTTEGKFMESGYDGTSFWMVSYPTKEYAINAGPNDLYLAKYVPPPKPANAGEGTFNFLYNNGYNIRFIASPALKIVSDEVTKLGGVPARKIVAEAILVKDQRYVKVTQWFFTDKWILRQFLVEGKGPEAGKFMVGGTVTEASFAAGTKPAQFKMDPKMVKGFKKVEPKKKP